MKKILLFSLVLFVSGFSFSHADDEIVLGELKGSGVGTTEYIYPNDPLIRLEEDCQGAANLRETQSGFLVDFLVLNCEGNPSQDHPFFLARVGNDLYLGDSDGAPDFSKGKIGRVSSDGTIEAEFRSTRQAVVQIKQETPGISCGLQRARRETWSLESVLKYSFRKIDGGYRVKREASSEEVRTVFVRGRECPTKNYETAERFRLYSTIEVDLRSK